MNQTQNSKDYDSTSMESSNMHWLGLKLGLWLDRVRIRCCSSS